MELLLLESGEAEFNCGRFDSPRYEHHEVESPEQLGELLEKSLIAASGGNHDPSTVPRLARRVEYPGRSGQLGAQRIGVPAERGKCRDCDPVAAMLAARSASQSAYTLPVRHGTTSSSRAGRPGDRSTIPDAYCVRRAFLACCQTCSSTPHADAGHIARMAQERLWTVRPIGLGRPTPGTSATGPARGVGRSR